LTKLLDFDTDVVAAVEALVPTSSAGREVISTLNATEAWNAYRARQSRFVTVQARTLHVSRELAAELLRRPAEEADATRTVLDEIRDGDDLTARLSGLTRNFHDPGETQDRDRMLNDWGVHHLHLGPHTGSTKPVKRTRDLLFVVFLEDHAYAITVLPHGHWADEDILRVMANNWPDDGVIHGASGAIVGLADPIDPTRRQELRDAGVSAAYQHDDGRVYLPRGLMSTAGTSMLVGLHADQELRMLRDIEARLEAAPVRLDVLVRNAGAQLGGRFEWRLRWEEDNWWLVEQHRKIGYQLSHVAQFIFQHPAGHECGDCTIVDERSDQGLP